MKYYLAKKHAVFATAELALAAAGFRPEDAKLVIENSRVNASEAIVVGLDKERGTALVVTTNGEGGVTLWRALIGERNLFDSGEEAQEYAEALAKSYGDREPWAVFSWANNRSTAIH
jgi:hypothetical protein